MGRFAGIAEGRERWEAHYRIPRHRHDRAYVAVVLSGGYEECGSRGRFHVGPGDVLLHAPFDAHLNRFPRRGAHLLNLAIGVPGFALGRVSDPDAIARAAERDPAEARASLRVQLKQAQPAAQDWPDLLARDLIADPGCRLDAWAERHGLAAETVSRGFSRVFGVAPATFRQEARAQRAFTLILSGKAPLAAVAATAGFADQAHMCRGVRALTGRPPSAWRTSIPFKTADSDAA